LAAPAGRDVDEIVRAGAMTIERLLVATAAVGMVESVTVITAALVPAAVGVPLIAPPAFIVSPGGSPVAEKL
jgi:hypothetical protein